MKSEKSTKKRLCSRKEILLDSMNGEPITLEIIEVKVLGRAGKSTGR